MMMAMLLGSGTPQQQYQALNQEWSLQLLQFEFGLPPAFRSFSADQSFTRMTAMTVGLTSVHEWNHDTFFSVAFVDRSRRG